MSASPFRLGLVATFFAIYLALAGSARGADKPAILVYLLDGVDPNVSAETVIERASTARMVPDRSRSSTYARRSRSSEPWCRARSAAQSGLARKSERNQISAWLRVLVNSKLVRADSMATITSANSRVPKCPDQGKRSMSAGTIVSIDSGLVAEPEMMTPRAEGLPAVSRVEPSNHPCRRPATFSKSPSAAGA